MAHQILPVVLSGGSGTRLWPLSRSGYPKQFLPLVSELSLFQDTLLRVKGIEGVANPLVVCNAEHRFIIAEQAQNIGHRLGDIILEPQAKNTAPAIALAALRALADQEDPLLLVLPSDHVFKHPEAFQEAVSKAAKLAAQGDLVTFGVLPTRPETGFGYIQAAEARADHGYAVARFVEKPDAHTAQKYLDTGGYFWNSGMFMFRATVYLKELEAFHPDIFHSCQQAMAQATNDLDFCRVGATPFAGCPSESIDYAVMEKTLRAAVVPLAAGWSDVGAWPAVWEASPQDAQGNATHGDVLLENTTNSFVYAQSRLVCALGLDNIVLIETPDAVLVMPHGHAQDIKKIVDTLKRKQRIEAVMHRQVYRPWGSYDEIDEGHRFKVKRIVVKPGQKLSLQMHHHRAEHWIVVSGTALVTIDGKEHLLSENQSTYIPLGHQHRLENPGKVDLNLIEVQSGSYLGEDDIVRIHDTYGRVN